MTPWRLRPRPRACLLPKDKSQVKPALPRVISAPIVTRPDGRVPPVLQKKPLPKPRIITVPPTPKVYPRVFRRIPIPIAPTPVRHPPVREPKEGELVLSEPPSVYFRRIGKTINPPVYLN